jgi:dsDNA-binding SOS-regulon protein
MHFSRSKPVFAALVLALALFAPHAHSASPTLPIAEQEVIEALISQDSATKFSKKHIIKETTSVRELHMSESYDAFSERLRRGANDRDEAFKEALDDFLKKNKTAVKIVFSTNAPKSIELVSEATVKEIFSAKSNAKPNGWDVFYRRFPDAGGLIEISRVGIDSKGTVAIIYLGKQSDYVAGSGSIRVMRREAGQWVLKHERIGGRWVS